MQFPFGAINDSSAVGLDKLMDPPPGLCLPYRRLFLSLHSSLQQVLLAWDISSSQADGERLQLLQDLEPELLETLAEELGLASQGDATIGWQTINSLITQVKKGSPSAKFNWHQQQWQLRDRERHVTSMGVLKVIQTSPQKWRHWKPGKAKLCSTISQHSLETQLKQKWAQRIASWLMPHAGSFQHINALLEAKSSETEVLHLMGATRFRTLRQHCLNLEFILKLPVELPWSEDSIRQMLNLSKSLELTPSRVANLWNTIRWISKRFGGIDPHSVDRLTQKRDAVLEELTQAVTKPQRKARVPPVELVAAMELGAAGAVGPERSSWSTRYILAIARFMVGASARFNDIQHCCPREVRVTSNSIEMVAWQSKTTSVAKPQSKPCVLICPQLSFSGAKWWLDLLKMLRSLTDHPTLGDMDYLLPTIGRDSSGIIQRPGSYERCLKWFRSSLITIGISGEKANSISWHSCRVFIPHWAFQVGISKDQRQYLGNWSNESTADVYTREKRNVVSKIWSYVMEHIPKKSTEEELRPDGGTYARVDLHHEDYLPGANGPDTVPRTDTGGSWNMITEVDSEQPNSAQAASPSISPCDKVGPPRGPLTIVGRKLSRSVKLHLLDVDRKAIGCGWRPALEHMNIISASDYREDISNFTQCERCFKFYSLPLEWGSQTSTDIQDGFSSSSSSDSGSLTDDSVDTASVEEEIHEEELIGLMA